LERVHIPDTAMEIARDEFGNCSRGLVFTCSKAQSVAIHNAKKDWNVEVVINH